MKLLRSLLIVVIIFTMGCSSSVTSNFLLPASSVNNIGCVAVLPLKNKTQDPNAGNVLADILSIDLMKHGNFSVMDRMEVERVLRERDIYTPDGISPEDASGIGVILGVQAVFSGEVTKYYYKPSSLPTEGAVPTVEFTLSLIDTATGQTIWTGNGTFTPSGIIAEGTPPITEVAQDGIKDLLGSFYESIGPVAEASSNVCWYDPNIIFSRVIIARPQVPQPQQPSYTPPAQPKPQQQQRIASVEKPRVQVPPAKVSILNASGNPRASMLVGVALIKDKINVVNVSTEKYTKPKTIIYYQPDYYDQALHIGRLLKKMPELVESRAYKWNITLVIGKDLK
ncbi:MAG: CsgG/HfaB family protein [bacterium]